MRPLTPSGRPRARGLPPPPAGPSPLPAEAGARGRGSDLPGVSPQRRAPDRAARGPRLCPGPGPAALRARPCAGHTPAAFLRWRPLRVSVFACSCLAARPFRGAFRAPPARSLGVVTELRTAPRVRSASPRLCRPGQGPCAKPLPRGAGECRPGRLDRPGPSGEGLAAMTAASRQRALWVPTLWPAGWALAIGYLSGALPRWGWRCGARHSSGAGRGGLVLAFEAPGVPARPLGRSRRHLGVWWKEPRRGLPQPTGGPLVPRLETAGGCFLPTAPQSITGPCGGFPARGPFLGLLSVRRDSLGGGSAASPRRRSGAQALGSGSWAFPFCLLLSECGAGPVSGPAWRPDVRGVGQQVSCEALGLPSSSLWPRGLWAKP